MSPRFRAGLHALLLVAAVLALSTLSMKVWGGRPERAATRIALEVRPEMTIAEIGQRNRLPRSVLQRAFDLHSADELKRPLAWTGLSVPAAIERLHRARALEAEAGSKNWQKIVLKFALWIAFLGVVLTLLRRRRVTPARRRVLYGVAVALFGVTLGADPSPMGTVKDALVLYGRSHVVFPPRMIALGVFLLLVILANKLICSWGCQAGTLQDLLFRIGRDPGDRRSLWPQLRPPFWLANGVRVTFFVLLVAGAFLWAVDVVEPLDPFKVLSPRPWGSSEGSRWAPCWWRACSSTGPGVTSSAPSVWWAGSPSRSRSCASGSATTAASAARPAPGPAPRPS